MKPCPFMNQPFKWTMFIWDLIESDKSIHAHQPIRFTAYYRNKLPKIILRKTSPFVKYFQYFPCLSYLSYPIVPLKSRVFKKTPMKIKTAKPDVFPRHALYGQLWCLNASIRWKKPSTDRLVHSAIYLTEDQQNGG